MDNLKQKKLLDIMARMRSLVPPEEATPECSEVDWAVPHHFSVEWLDELTDMGNKLAGCIEQTLHHLCGGDFEAKLGGMTECFAGFLSEEINQQQQSHYFLPVSLADKGEVGFIGLSFETCTVLIRQILCDPEAEIGQEGGLSVLEESILQDAAFSITDSLLQSFLDLGQMKMQKGEQLVHGVWPVSFCGLEEMSRLSFEAGCESIQLEVSLYLLDEVIDSLFGISLPDAGPGQSTESSARITERMHNVVTDVTVKLNSAMMKLENILTLEKDDVVVLGHKVAVPADVLVNEQRCFKAWPAKSEGCGAVVIAEKELDG